MLKYLGRQHIYGQFDCIILVQEFYKNELGVSFDLPPYLHSPMWMRDYTTHRFDKLVEKSGVKVSLTEAKNYDLIVFKSDKSNLITHFGIYLMPNKILHVEENSKSCIDILNDYWVRHIYAVFRHDALV